MLIDDNDGGNSHYKLMSMMYYYSYSKEKKSIIQVNDGVKCIVFFRFCQNWKISIQFSI